MEFIGTENKNSNNYDHIYDEQYELLSDHTVSEYNITEDEDEEENLGVSKYNNIMGITCYINSILHILQQIPIFVKYIYEFEFEEILLEKIMQTEYEINTFVIYELHRLFKNSVDYENSTITPTSFKNLIGEKNDMWNEYNHQDSQEFFNFLISQIKEEIGKKVKIIPELGLTNYQRSVTDAIDNIIATNAINMYQSHEYSLLTELFNGLYKNTCCCDCCKSTNIKFEPFLTLAIDINNNNDLYDCLDQLCYEQQLDDANKLTCGFCGLSNRAHKKTLLWKTPKVLVIHIKRFGIGAEKITTNIDYPIKNLDLSNYIDSKSPYKLNCKYDLIGVNLHQTFGHRQNINTGHYTSLVKNMTNNKWYLYNDSDQPKLQFKKEDLQSRDAYMLFYYRHN